jgi:hypothetical protein
MAHVHKARVSGHAADFSARARLQVEWIAAATLKPAHANARTHSNRQIEQIAQSIKRFGFLNPVLSDASGGIIAGHGRVAAAKLLGLTQVPTLRIEHLSDAEKRAYILADNKLADKAGWDREILAIELQALVDMDFEIELTGFEMAEVDFILDEATEINQAALLPEDSVPELSARRPITKPSDLWLLGAHRLSCGDARDECAYEALMNGTKANFVFSDPPYNVPIDGHVSGLGRIRHREFAMGCGEMSQAEYTTFLEKVFRLLCAHTEGAQFSWILGRWRVAARCPALHVVGLSATLRDATGHLAKVAGLLVQNVKEFHPIENSDPTSTEIETESIEYNLAVKGNASSGASLLATSIQSAMLGTRLLTPRHVPTGIANDNKVGDATDYYGRKAFGFTDNLDSLNRWFADLSDAETKKRLARFRATASTNDAAVLRNMRQDGQLWELPERLHYDLQQSLRISRCSSQDTGANVQSDVIVATSSLEVGYDDPEVGLILHHKAPRSMSSFIQRKGRSGRRRGTRPTTMVVLSDYGVDRWMFQNSERLFEPQVDQIHLPLSNPYVLRIQATSFMIDWIGRKIGKGNPYTFLRRPTNDRSTVERVQRLLSNMLTLEGPDWNSFRKDLTELFRRVIGYTLSSAQIDLAIDSVLWDAPPPILRHAIPALLRKLESNWQYADPSRRFEIEDKDKNRPLPDFLPSASFNDLEQAEVELRFPTGKESQWMGVSRALSEACPARVSKRFSVRLGELGYWLEFSPRLLENPPETVSISEIFPDRLFVRTVNEIQVYQPQYLSLCERPRSVLDSSMGYWEWDSDLQPLTNGTEVPLLLSDQLRGVIERVDAHLHRDQGGVRVLRHARTARYEILLSRGRVVRGRLELGTGDQTISEAVGFEQTVDGLRFKILGTHLNTAPVSDADELARLRTDYFLHRLQQSEVLAARTNTFNVELLWRTSVAMLTATALRQDCTLQEAQHRLAGHRPAAAARVLDRIFGGVSEDDSSDPEQSGGRQRDRLLELWSDEALLREIEILERTLWEPPDGILASWLRERHLQTLAQSFRTAVMTAIEDISEDDLQVDVVSLEMGAEIYVTETTPGGLGHIERILEAFAREPDIFDDAVRYALEHCEQDATTLKLLGILKASRVVGGALEGAFQVARQARGFVHLRTAINQLKLALEESGFDSSRQVIVPLATRFLRPGSTRITDALTIGLNRSSQSYSRRLGLKIDTRVFAYLCVDYAPLRRRLKNYFRGTVGETPTDAQLFAIIQDNLLSDCQDSCPYCLRNDNWFGSHVQPSRGVTRRWLDLDRVDVPVHTSEGDWMDAVRHRLGKERRARLLVHQENLQAVAQKIQLLLAEEFECDFVFAPVQIARLERIGGDWSFLLKIKDVPSTPI